MKRLQELSRKISWEARAFWVVLAVGMLIKVVIAIRLPLIGDELLYVGVWGRHLALGYYEHPPMTGWLAALLLVVSSAPAWMRLPAILLSPLVAWGIVRLAQGRSAESRRSAWYAGAAFYLVPLSLFAVVLATDTALIGWLFFAFYFFWRADDAKGRSLWVASTLAGLCWGGAFLSKYFALLALPSLFIYLVALAPVRSRWVRAVGFVIGAAPALGLHLGWNATHCWSNVVYNFMMRNAEEVGGWFQVRKFLSHQLYLLTPVIPMLLAWRWRRIGQLIRDRGRSSESRQFWLFGLGYLIPMLIFTYYSTRVGLGLHYYLSFFPFLFVVMALVFRPVQWKWLVGAFTLWSVGHGVAIGWALHQPLSYWRDRPFYRGLVMHERMSEVAKQFAPYLDTHILASDSYTSAAALAYATGRDVVVFGGGISMAREDDRLSDYPSFNGKSFAFFWPNPTDGSHVRFFKRHERHPFVIEGVTYELVLADGFDYPRYHREVLTWIQGMFYRKPPYLPQWGCPFTERYFKD